VEKRIETKRFSANESTFHKPLGLDTSLGLGTLRYST